MNLIREQEISKNEIQPQIMTTIFFYEKRILIFLGPPVSSTNKTDSHDITEILLKVALSTIKQTNKQTNIILNKKLIFKMKYEQWMFISVTPT